MADSGILSDITNVKEETVSKLEDDQSAEDEEELINECFTNSISQEYKILPIMFDKCDSRLKHKMPSYASSGSIGLDIFIPYDLKNIEKRNCFNIPTNIYMREKFRNFLIKNDLHLEIFPKSTRFETFEISVGLVDPDYSGEIFVKAISSKNVKLIKAGTAIAQFVIRQSFKKKIEKTFMCFKELIWKEEADHQDK